MVASSSYSPLFSLGIEHGFFSDGLCRALSFVPTPQTEMVIGKSGLLIRKTMNGLRVFYDETRYDALLSYASVSDEPLTLEFKAFASDPLFANYTEPSVYKDGSILYFSNRDAEADSEGKARLHREEFVSAADFEELSSPLLEGVISHRDSLSNPILVISIGLSEDEVASLKQASKPSAKKYYVSFQAEQTIWKYYLLGDLAKADFYVNDREEQIEFVPEGETFLADNRLALSFRSKTLLPFRERSNYHFQLRDKNSGGGRVLIRRLPVASPGQISRETIDGAKTLVSEMFINR